MDEIPIDPQELVKELALIIGNMVVETAVLRIGNRRLVEGMDRMTERFGNDS